MTMTIEILQRFYGKPRELGDLFVLANDRVTARCLLVTHPLGWECRSVVDRGLVMSQVCRSQEAVFTTWKTWKAAMNERGWG